MRGQESLLVGIVLRRSRSRHPWQDFAWRTAEAVPGAPATGNWRLLRQSEAEADYLAPALPLCLYPAETAGYLQNLSQRAPMVYVVLRRDENQDGPPLRPFHITACPTEAQDYLDGDDVVDTVPMPAAIAEWLRDYVRRFHVDKPFVKRQRRDSPAGQPLRRSKGGHDG